MQSMARPSPISVTVCFAQADHQEVIPLTVSPGTTVLQAIEQSGIVSRCPQARVHEGNVGVYGTPVRLDRRLQNHDRVEIYRPLHRSPAEARRQLAEGEK